MANKRIVKLIPRKPLYGIKRTPINSCVEKIELTTEEIRLCLVTKCLVDEYLPDGSLRRLDLSNYNTIIKEESPIIVTTEENTDKVSSEVGINGEFKFDDDFKRNDEAVGPGWGDENPVNALLTLSVAEPNLVEAPQGDQSIVNIESISDDTSTPGPLYEEESDSNLISNDPVLNIESKVDIKEEIVINTESDNAGSNVNLQNKNQSNKKDSKKKH